MQWKTAMVAIVCGGLLWGCATEQAPSAKAQGPAGQGERFDPSTVTRQYQSFRQYWYQGKAELGHYKLEQARYGEVHPGEAVMIFVTEDFLTDKQIKYEFGPRDKAVPILKLNAYRRFYTGLYPYTLLTSVFKPTEPMDAPALKVAASVQEWCGMAYTQFNRRQGQWEVDTHSYFQAEGDRQFTFPEAPSEDAIWVQLRRDPKGLPTGQGQMVPALHHLRLLHKPIQSYQAQMEHKLQQESPFSDKPVNLWSVHYPDLGRRLELHYDPAPPHLILGWEERGAGLNGRELTTRGTLDRVMLEDYWSHHKLSDAPMRRELGLE